MIRYLLLFIFLMLAISSSFLFDYWAFIIDLITQYHTELFDFIENKFFSSLILFTIIYVVSIAISLPIGSFLTFIGGYIFGKFFKGPKLTKISPNKTYAGTFGGFLLAVVASLIYSYYINSEPWSHFPWKFLELTKNYETTFLTFVLIISLTSQIGDLILSYFKRLAKVKDTGKILPGHGGLLDRIDGLIFSIPISYLLIYPLT